MTAEIAALEREVMEKQRELAELKRAQPPQPVDDYAFRNSGGEVRLGELFGDHDDLIVIHNMGKSCVYCTLWADGFNGVYPHLQNRAGFVLTSNDPVDEQAEFAASRDWRFPVVSARGGSFTNDMGFGEPGNWAPGVSTFRRTNGAIERIASSPLGPFDPFCSVWHLFALLQDGPNDWQPKYKY